ncbi:MAG TPA: flagellar hook capping FlgD N-terminal domain-containing protein, partial [Burkholderiaceae bacterium]|nr:flagellar hook capping FlgD N-terminal domain-containing protein [Burkholderiaceae bacterium]
MTVTNTNSATTTTGTSGTTGTSSMDASSAADLSNRFLTLLVAQMSNQDPLNPMDSSEVTSQMS